MVASSPPQVNKNPAAVSTLPLIVASSFMLGLGLMMLRCCSPSHRVARLRGLGWGGWGGADDDTVPSDYYKILGIPSDATTDEVKRAYRSLSQKWHPDKHHTPATKMRAHERFKVLLQAYKCLSDEEKRRQYDISRYPHDYGDQGSGDAFNKGSPSEYHQENGDVPGIFYGGGASSSSLDPSPPFSSSAPPQSSAHSGYNPTRETPNLTSQNEHVAFRLCSAATHVAHRGISLVRGCLHRGVKVAFPFIFGRSLEREITRNNKGELVERTSVFTRQRDGTVLIETNDRVLTEREVERLMAGRSLRPMRALLLRVAQGLAWNLLQLAVIYALGRLWDLLVLADFFSY